MFGYDLKKGSLSGLLIVEKNPTKNKDTQMLKKAMGERHEPTKTNSCLIGNCCNYCLSKLALLFSS